MNEQRKRWIKTTIITLIVVLIFVFLGKNLYENWKQIPFERFHFNYIFILIAYGFAFLGLPLTGISWVLILHSLGERLSIKKSMSILALTQLAKYVPGKVLSIFSGIYLAKREGVSTTNSFISSILGTILLVLGGLISLLLLLVTLYGEHTFSRWYPLLGLIPLGVIIIHPSIVSKLINVIHKIAKKESPPKNLSYSYNWLPLLIYTLVALIQGITFFFFVRSVYPVPFSLVPQFAASFIIANIIGYISVVFPQGIGIREGILTLLLGNYLPSSLVIVMVFLARFFGILGDVMGFLIFARELKKRPSLY